MDGLSSTIGEHHAHFTSMCAQLNRTHTQKESAQDELIEDHRQYFSTVFTKLERKVAEDTASLDQRMLEKTSAQDERLDEITSTVEDHHDHFTTVCAQLDRRFTETHELQEARVKEVHQHFTVVGNKLDAKIDQEVASQDERMGAYHDRYATSAEALEQRVLEESTALDRKFTDVCSQLDTKFSEKVGAQDKRIDGDHAHLQETCSALERRLEAELADVGSMVTDRASAVDARTDELWSTVEEHHGHFTDVCAKLDGKLVEQVARLDAQAEQEHSYIVDTAASLDEKLSSTLQRLDEQQTEKNATQDERMDELSGAVAEHHTHFTAVCGKLDKKFVEKDAEQDDIIENHRKYFTTVCSKLDKKHSEKAASLEAQVQANHDHGSSRHTALDTRVTSELEQLSERLTGSVVRLDRAFADKSSEQDARLDE
jgi:hypothetical protein